MTSQHHSELFEMQESQSDKRNSSKVGWAAPIVDMMEVVPTELETEFEVSSWCNPSIQTAD